MPPVVGRYAPSPTGALHLGNLRTALAAFLHARSRQGFCLLRVEDLDPPRVVPGAEANQIADLAALALVWDGETIRQSERTRVYDHALDNLIERGLAYPCFCSRKDVREAASAPHDDNAPLTYPGTCAQLDPDEARHRIEAGEQHSYRLRVKGAPRTFTDIFAGTISIDLPNQGGDFVIRRADGLYAYQLACAVDDALTSVTDVLRGADLLDSAARQAWLLQCIGYPVPDYYHIPLLHGPNGQRLAKRDGADDLRAYFDLGLNTVQIRSYLAWTLGQCDKGEKHTLDELIVGFDLNRIPLDDVEVHDEDLRAFRS